jgi:hypothetical protein
MRELLLLSALAVAVPNAALAGQVADHAVAAEKALEGGDAAAAIREFDRAQDALWTAMPLTIRKAEQVSSASGVGVYTPRADHRYRSGESLHLYVEPVGYGFGDDGLGNKLIALNVDMTLRSEAGEALGTIENITTINVSSRVKNRELFLSLNLTLDESSLPLGKYKAEFVIRDQNSDKKVGFLTDFEFAK